MPARKRYVCCVWVGWEACEGSSRGGDKCILMAVSHIVRQKPTQHCKAIIFHIKKKQKERKQSVLAMWLLIIDNVNFSAFKLFTFVFQIFCYFGKVNIISQ